jgi:Kdo2-lipid IVA lauroyltransferase/acyltransferase
MRKIAGVVFFYLIPIRKTVALNNLSLCFPDKDENWKIDIVKKCYINLGINLLEILYLPKMHKELLDTFISYERSQLIVQALEKGHGVFFISGHIANWEITAFSYAKIFRGKLNILAKTQSNKYVDERLNYYREISGNEIIPVGAPIRNVFKKILRNEIVCFLVDQSAHPLYSVYADFFGHKVATFSGPAKMALKFKTELIFASARRLPNYTYFISVDTIEYDDLKEYNDENIAILTGRINKKLENVIRENPSQWLWFHRRFKHIKDDGKK